MTGDELHKIALRYLEQGFEPLPLPPGLKWPPPSGFTGYKGRSVTRDMWDNWLTVGIRLSANGEVFHDGPIDGCNIGLRMPPGVIGIDVDQYGAKNGAATIAELEATLGLLPPTYAGSSRPGTGSGIWLYRVPVGTALVTEITDVELIQPHHRYMVTAPSIHPEGRPYELFDPQGADLGLDDIPHVDDITPLPWSWVEHLRKRCGGVTVDPATVAQVREFIDAHSGALRPGALTGITTKLDNATGARHDTLVTVACWAMREAAAGVFPASDAIAALERWWTKVMDPGNRAGTSLDEGHIGEFGSAIMFAIGQAAADPARLAEIRLKNDPIAQLEQMMGAPDDTNTVERVNPDLFFDRMGLRHKTLRDAVTTAGPIARGPGDSLWRYADGVWLPDGADEVRRRVSRFLGERHRKSHAEGVVADLASHETFITDEQPTRYINCRNGLLDWRTGELHPHTPSVPSTYQLAVPWDPSATCPSVDEWMQSVLPDDAIDLAWEVTGTAVYPDQPFHRAVLALGPGRNGKGTWLRLIGSMIGREHISAVTLQSLGESRFTAAELFGKVANISGDLDARSIQRTDLFKMATGGDLIHAERKYGAPFSFHNRATMLFSANEAPGTNDHTDGFFARWVVIPFTRLQLAAGQEDPSIEARMQLELAGVLVRAINGLRRAMDRGGYAAPGSVKEATESYRENADPLRRFLEDCLTITGDRADKAPRASVYATYKRWCEENGHRPLGANRYWGRLKALDHRICTDRTIGGTRFVDGVRLLENWL